MKEDERNKARRKVTMHLNHTSDCIADKNMMAYKVFMLCPKHKELETPFVHHPVMDFCVSDPDRGFFAFLSLNLAETFAANLAKKRWGNRQFVVLRYIMPEGTFYQRGRLPRGCNSEGIPCIKATVLVRERG